MREEAFAEYLGSRVPKSAGTYLSDLRRIEELYGDLDALHKAGRLEEIERSLRLDPSAPEPLPITPKRSSIDRYATPVRHYRDFLREGFLADDADAPVETPESPDAAAYTEGVEGVLREARYLMRARNRTLVDAARARDGCRCQACGYLNRIEGRYIIEVHHLNPLGAAETAVVTHLKDLVCLCPNCHRSAHARREAPLTLDELRALTAVRATRNATGASPDDS